ncbi:cyclin-dependent kinase inhibitor 1B-like [Corticium candelabrum]|uniref:cyclin-dependent kinase inhibitor 1B-like n=1 Tax=Corticium candelabrum TaxID=121492 RepID=UPI002E265A8B|nr:cyclin-dependent kinase inhibitor 1B-like [Corticium candelabrum]
MDNLKASLLPTQARKCLFGQPDHNETDKYLNSELEKINERHRERWNFDFDSEQPLEGNWQWEKVEPEMTTTVQTAERIQMGESVGTASAGACGARPLTRVEKRASRTRQSRRVEEEATETERDALGLASRLLGEKATSDRETTGTATTASPSKRTETAHTVAESSLRQSPRRKARREIADYYSVRKRYSSSSDMPKQDTSSKKKANQTPTRQSKRLSEKKRRDARPRSLSFESCSPTSC